MGNMQPDSLTSPKTDLLSQLRPNFHLVFVCFLWWNLAGTIPVAFDMLTVPGYPIDIPTPGLCVALSIYTFFHTAKLIQKQSAKRSLAKNALLLIVLSLVLGTVSTSTSSYSGSKISVLELWQNLRSDLPGGKRLF